MKRNRFIGIVLLFVIFLLILGLIAVTFPDFKEFIACLENIVVSISTIISIPTIFFLFKEYQEKQQEKWEKKQQLLREKDKYLNISVDSQNHNGYVSIKTQVFNQTSDIQKIDYALILISEQDSWTDIFDYLYRKYGLRIGSTNDLIKFKDIVEIPQWIPECAVGIIPIGFYYRENLRISNENPSFVYSFDNKEIKLPTGIYSVRFYIFPNDERYHRSTVGSLIIPETY